MKGVKEERQKETWTVGMNMVYICMSHKHGDQLTVEHALACVQHSIIIIPSYGSEYHN